ncbi:MAG: glycerol kinase GlpK [Gammaproteobacteria bacterium]
MGCILALDQGTTSSRTIIFDEQRRVVGFAQLPFEQHFPAPGRVEHDAKAIWRTQRATINAALDEANLKAADIAAIGITNQRETTVVWDRRTGEPVYNAIVWQDGRTAAECERKRAAGLEPQIQRATGLLLDPYFSASKIRWILDHCDCAAAAAAGHLAFGTIDSWLVWNLTGGRTHVTDPSNASRTALFNLHRLEWDEELLDVWQLPRSLLADITPSSGITAKCSLPELQSVPIAGIAGDQQAALFGQACYNLGDAKCTYGTGCFLLQNCGTAPVVSQQRLLSTVAWQIEGEEAEYALEGSVFMGGAVIAWLRDGLGLIEHAADVEALAAGVATSDGVVFVPAFTGLGAPYWDPHARASIQGMTRGTTRAHIALAALEGIAFQVADVLGAMQVDTGASLTSLKVDGGASANTLLMQLQADLLDVRLERPQNLESTALGCASLAGLAVKLWRDRSELAALAKPSAVFTPRPDDGTLGQRARQWARAVARSRDWAGVDNTS